MRLLVPCGISVGHIDQKQNVLSSQMCQINPGGITVLSLPPARCQRRYAKTQDLRSRVSYSSTQNIHNIIKSHLSYQKTRKSNLIDICQTCQKSTSYTLFANTYGTFVKIDYILSHKPTSKHY